MSKKKFEQSGTYSAITRAFERDAEIARKREQQPTQQPEAKPQPKSEPVAQIIPQAPPVAETVESARPRTPIPASSKRSPRKEPREKAQEREDAPQPKASRSTRAGGRLPAVRIECLPDEFAEVEQLVFNLGRTAGHKLSINIIGRALLRLALEAEDEIRRAVERNPPRRRPANGDSEEMARHEDEWQQVVAEAMRTLRVKR